MVSLLIQISCSAWFCSKTCQEFAISNYHRVWNCSTYFQIPLTSPCSYYVPVIEGWRSSFGKLKVVANSLRWHSWHILHCRFQYSVIVLSCCCESWLLLLRQRNKRPNLSRPAWRFCTRRLLYFFPLPYLVFSLQRPSFVKMSHYDTRTKKYEHEEVTYPFFVEKKAVVEKFVVSLKEAPFYSDKYSQSAKQYRK